MLDALKSIPTTARRGSLSRPGATAYTGTGAVRLTLSAVSPPKIRSAGECRPTPSTTITTSLARDALAISPAGDPIRTWIGHISELPVTAAIWPFTRAVRSSPRCWSNAS